MSGTEALRAHHGLGGRVNVGVRNPPHTDDVKELRREIRQLRSAYESVKRRLDLALDTDCRTCKGRGSIEGFFLGTMKRCPACNGSGLRGRYA